MKIGRLGLKQAPASLHDFVPQLSETGRSRGKLAQRPHGNNDLLHQAPMMKGDNQEREQSQDAAAILAVMEDVYEASPWKLEQIEADLEQESISYFLAVDEGQVLGFVAIQETLYEAEVLQIAVKRAFQGQGLAQQLLAQLPDQKEIFLEVRVSNQPAQGLYKKMHFEEIARRKNYYHDPIEDAVIMKRNPNER